MKIEIRKAKSGATPRNDSRGGMHELASNLLLFLAAMHVAGVMWESRALRRNLVTPMLFGERRK